jgi:hypothetical protein
LYKCYQWFLDNIDDDELKKRGCPAEMVTTMHMIHDEIVNGQSHETTMKKRLVRQNVIHLMHQLYAGQPRRNTRVVTAYALLAKGKSEDYLIINGFGRDEIEKAVKFKDNFAHRDMLRSVLAKELQVSQGTARRLQESVRIHQAAV